MILAEASYHAPYDHCTSKYLTQAGVKNDFIKLADWIAATATSCSSRSKTSRSPA